MASLTQVIRERKLVIRNLKKSLKVVDSNLELAERLISRILQRKLKVPEVSDLAILADYARQMSAGLSSYLKILNQGYLT